MNQLSDTAAAELGIYTRHHEMDNGELRFRLLSETGSSYILTKSTTQNGWQNSHVHYKMREYYVVEKGIALFALFKDGELKVEKLCENDSIMIPLGVPHNVLLSEHALLHTIKFGTNEEDWTVCEELDALLAKVETEKFFRCQATGSCLY